MKLALAILVLVTLTGYSQEYKRQTGDIAFIEDVRPKAVILPTVPTFDQFTTLDIFIQTLQANLDNPEFTHAFAYLRRTRTIQADGEDRDGVDGVWIQPADVAEANAHNGKLTVYRIKYINQLPRLLRFVILVKFRAELKKMKGLPYNTNYSPTAEGKYCFQLVAEALNNTFFGCRIVRTRAFNTLNYQPFEFLCALIGINLDQQVYTAEDLTRCWLLEKVYETPTTEDFCK